MIAHAENTRAALTLKTIVPPFRRQDHSESIGERMQTHGSQDRDLLAR